MHALKRLIGSGCVLIIAGCQAPARQHEATAPAPSHAKPSTATRTFPLHRGGKHPFAAAEASADTAGHLPRELSTGDFHGCPPEGKGGDALLNTLKNRDKAIDADAYSELDLAELLDYQPELLMDQGEKARERWSADAVSLVAGLESTPVVVEGYLIGVLAEGKEACNCGVKDFYDHHLWIVPDRSDAKSNSVVVEISPRMWETHPNWTYERLRALAKLRTRVRISGWPLWDQEHTEAVGRSRGTLWEIHPIHRIEVFGHGKWSDLDR